MKIKSIINTSLVATTIWAGISIAEEIVNEKDIVVTTSHSKTSINKVGRSITVITREDIENSKAIFVKDILKTVPGLDVWGTGPHASSASISIRGMKSYHTKFLINGVPMQDAATPQTTPIFASLTLENVERIEILRGTASTIHGSSAIGGVINIITRKGSGKPNGSVSIEGGSHETWKSTLNLSGSCKGFDYSLNSSYFGSGGIDVLDNGDLDRYRNQSHALRLGYQIDDNWRINTFALYNDTDEEIDVAWGGDDMHLQNWTAGLELQAKNLFDCLDSSLKYARTETQRAMKDGSSKFVSYTDLFTFANKLTINQRVALGFGMDLETEEADSNWMTSERHRTTASWLELNLEPMDNLFITTGVRYNDHSAFGHKITSSVSIAYQIEQTGTRLKASWANGYRTPSLNELFGLWGGDPTLQPEESESWDIGFEQAIFEERLKFGITYFETRLTDAIIYALPWGPYGTDSGIKNHGIESFIQYQLLDNLDLRASHTYMHSNNMETETAGARRIPRHKGTLGINYRLLDDKLNMNLTANYAGKRQDIAVSLHSYVLANFAISYDLNDRIQLYGRINNLLNENYEVVDGYHAYARCYYGGLKISF